MIEFEPKERILEKAKSYVESLDLFFEEGDRAVPLLLKAMKLADGDLKREIISTCTGSASWTRTAGFADWR